MAMLERVVVCTVGGGFRIFLLAGVFAVTALGCGAAPERVNDSGHDLLDAGEYGAAAETYRKAQELAPDAGEPYYNAGNALYRSGDYGGAIQEYDEAIKRAEGVLLRADAQFNRGNAFFQMQEYPDAVNAFKEALRLEPDNEETRHNLELAMRLLPTPEPQQGQEPDESPEPGPQGQQLQPNEQGQQQDDQEQEPQEEGDQQDEQDVQQQDEEEQDGEPNQQEREPRPQTEPITEDQARQLLEAMSNDAQTLQEQLQQVIVPRDPYWVQSEFDW